ncbi:MAG TPA: PilZ domain-containing protein [Nitrospiraceae bacterium]|nr:PilZ domain-containing protein [Nitrospiraceae bacterium]
MEKRAQPRFTAQFRSTFSGGQREGNGRTLDLSSGGCRIETDIPVVIGAAFECRIYAPSLDWPLRVDEAQVRWVRGNTFGVAFVKMRTEERAKLNNLVKALEAELNPVAPK